MPTCNKCQFFISRKNQPSIICKNSLCSQIFHKLCVNGSYQDLNDPNWKCPSCRPGISTTTTPTPPLTCELCKKNPLKRIIYTCNNCQLHFHKTCLNKLSSTTKSNFQNWTCSSCITKAVPSLN